MKASMYNFESYTLADLHALENRPDTFWYRDIIALMDDNALVQDFTDAGQSKEFHGNHLFLVKLENGETLNIFAQFDAFNDRW